MRNGDKDVGSGEVCRSCGWRFRGLIDGLCLSCHTMINGAPEDEYRALADYVRRNPNASVAAVSRGTGVRPARISALIEEGRLRAGKGSRPSGRRR